jgi:hypothetical protein
MCDHRKTTSGGVYLVDSTGLESYRFRIPFGQIVSPQGYFYF